MSFKTFGLIALAVGLAAFTGWVDVHNSEVQPAAACVLVFSGVLSIARPRLAWLWALLIGLSIPATHAIVRTAGIALPYSVNSFAGTFIALIPAALGAGIGCAIGFAIAAARADSHLERST